MKILEELERLHQAATRGPWEARQDSRFPTIKTASGESIAMLNLDAPINDAVAIAAAHNALPALLRVVRAAQEWERAAEAFGPMLMVDAGYEDAQDLYIRAEAELSAALDALGE